jgi:hypothetical protein
MTKEYTLTPEETLAFKNLKAQESSKQQELLAIQGALQGAVLMLTSQKGLLTSQGELNSDFTKLTVTVRDEEPAKEETAHTLEA